MNTDIITIVIVGVVALIIGYTIASTLLRKSIERKSKSILKDAQKASEQLKKDKILQAKEKFLELKSEHEKLINSRNQKISDLEAKAKRKILSSTNVSKNQKENLKTLIPSVRISPTKWRFLSVKSKNLKKRIQDKLRPWKPSLA